MKNFYFQRAALTLGIAAMAASGAMAEGTWRNVNNQYLKSPSFIPGWSGALTAVNEGVGETYNGAFEIYQVMDLPAGKYTLSCNAFYRFSNNADSEAQMKDGKNYNAYIFLGTAEKTVMGLFDGGMDAAPNDLAAANAAFSAGKYLNTIEFEHKGGDLKFGIRNLGGMQDEWCAFDNFKLTGPGGDIEVPNGDFAKGFPEYEKKNPVYGDWDLDQIANDPKSPDINKAGGVYRKTNASPYNFGQRVELPAGKYRLGIQSFLRFGGAGNVAGKYVTCKGAWGWVEDESAVDRHNNKTEDEADNAYLYVTDGWDLAADEVTELKPVDADGAKYGKADAFYLEQPVKCIFDEEMDTYPDNLPSAEGKDAFGYEWCDSGFEYQAAKTFVNNPDKYRNYIEFTLEAPAKVWVGLKKDVNAPVQYWNPFRDFTLERFDGGAGVEDLYVADENAPVEYYNLQGVRVANPANGLYIVKQGNKVSKKIFK